MIEEQRLTPAGVHHVWELLSDLEHWDQLLPTMRRVERLGASGPLGVGTRFRVLSRGLPPSVYEITDWQPNSGFTWVASSLGVRTTASHRLDPQDEGTRLVLTLDWSGPLAGLASLLLGSKVRRMVAQEADTFVRLSEDADRRD